MSDAIVEQALAYLETLYKRGQPFTSSHLASEYFCCRLGRYEHEVFTCAFLDTKYQLIACEDMFKGTIAFTSVYPREVVKRALQLNAAAVVFAHNHPSGVAEPSAGDTAMTQRLKEALDLIDVQVLDHIVVGGGTYASMVGRGLL